MLILTFVCIQTHAQVNIITTICGNDTAGYSGDNGNAINAKLNKPEGLFINKKGDIYITDGFNHRIRKISAVTGIITTVAGTGIGGLSGDNDLATNAQLFVPSAIFCDTADNMYIADGINNRIRKITASTGIITTIAGSGATGVGMGGDTGDSGPATNATLNVPVGLCLDNKKNVYVADYSNNKIRKIDAITGVITTVAGNGSTTYTGDGGLAINTGISGAIQVFVDNDDNIFFCDQWNHAVRKVTIATGIITTVAGNGTEGHSGDNGPATNAQLNQPSGIYVDNNGDVLISDFGSGTIRKVKVSTGVITTIAGNGTYGYSGDGGPATNAMLKCADIKLDKYGTVYIADVYNNRIRIVHDTMLRVEIKDVAVSGSPIRIYPNPTKNELTIEGITSQTGYRIINITGVEITNGICTASNPTISVHYLIPGIYLLELTDDNGQRQIVRVIKE